jgi:hypothetical protein
MTLIGYTMMCEQAGPKQLVRDVVLAEQAGFDFAVISDHYFPWLDSQGDSPYAWSVLGAAAQATDHVPLMTYVTCPIRRYHPAVVAQKARDDATAIRWSVHARAGRGAKTSTNTSSAVNGRSSACAMRCSTKRSRSSEPCGQATRSPIAGSTSTSSPRRSGTSPNRLRRSASPCPAREVAVWRDGTPTS